MLLVYKDVYKEDLWVNIYHSLNVAVKVHSFRLISSRIFFIVYADASSLRRDR